MEKYERITDEQIFKAIEDVKNEDEQSLASALQTLLLITLDIRQFLRKMYKNMPKKAKVYNRPTGNKKDVVVGGKK